MSSSTARVSTPSRHWAMTVAPGIRHQAVAVALLAPCPRAPLAAGGHVAAVLDGAGADERLPVIHPGGDGEGGRQQEELGARLGQGPEQLGEAEVVADGQAGDDAVAVEHADPVPRR